MVIILIPIFLLISLIILIDDGFPIFFRQNRIGKDNEIFVLYKFRTMVNGTPDIATDKLESPQNHFIKTGRLLRMLSLDELPQLFNIIKGNVNFIGPRPALYNQLELIDKRTMHGINTLKPGITGWAQVNGRDMLNIDEKVALDKYYMMNSSILLNIKIIFLTIVKTLKMVNVKL